MCCHSTSNINLASKSKDMLYLKSDDKDKSGSSGDAHMLQSGHALKFRQAPKKITDAYIW